MVTNGFIYLSFYLHILIYLTKQQRHISFPTPRKGKAGIEASNFFWTFHFFGCESVRAPDWSID